MCSWGSSFSWKVYWNFCLRNQTIRNKQRTLYSVKETGGQGTQLRYIGSKASEGKKSISEPLSEVRLNNVETALHCRLTPDVRWLLTWPKSIMILQSRLTRALSQRACFYLPACILYTVYNVTLLQCIWYYDIYDFLYIAYFYIRILYSVYCIHRTLGLYNNPEPKPLRQVNPNLSENKEKTCNLNSIEHEHLF